MATSNFYYKNASKVFAIGLDYERPILDDDYNETEENEIVSCDEFEYKMQIENIQEQLKENKGIFDYSEYEKNSQLDNRNFSASYIGTLSISKNFGDNNVEVNINCFSRAGYYEGACLDFETEIIMDNYETDNTEDVEDGFEYSNYFDINKGMGKIQARNAQKWANKIHSLMVETVEKTFENCSTCFKKVATFSNGETIYEKC